MASPDVVFNQTIDAALSRNNPRRQPETPATVDQWNLAKSLAFYKARFADASNFTFVFVGSFTPEMLKPFVETYIASLPATHASETWRDLGITPPTGVIDKKIEKGIAPKAQVAIVFSGPFEYDDAHRLALRTMTLLLQSRLLDTHPAGARRHLQHHRHAEREKFPKPEYNVRIEWTCDPARTATLVQRVFEEIEFVKATLHLARAGRADPRGAAARVRAEQPGQRLLAQPDRAPVRGRRGGGRRRRRELPGADRRADRRRDPGGGADLPDTATT